MSFLDSFLGALAGDLNDLAARRMFPAAALTDGRWNRNSYLHSRVHAAMIRATPRELVSHAEFNWRGSNCVDLVASRDDEEVVAIVEYESSNSSDGARVVARDLARMTDWITTHDPVADGILPEWWIVLTTLPAQPTVYLPVYRGTGVPAGAPIGSADRRGNPLGYFQPWFASEFAAAWSRIVAARGNAPGCHLVWANLAPDAIRVLHLDGVAVADRAFPLRLP